MKVLQNAEYLNDDLELVQSQLNMMLSGQKYLMSEVPRVSSRRRNTAFSDLGIPREIGGVAESAREQQDILDHRAVMGESDITTQASQQVEGAQKTGIAARNSKVRRKKGFPAREIPRV